MRMNVTFYAKILNERGRSINECRFSEVSVFCVTEFEDGVNDGIYLVTNNEGSTNLNT